MSGADARAELEARLVYTFDREALLEKALTHKSYANERADLELAHNERLEFLGDAVVDLAVGHLLMKAYPQWSEGRLSKARAMLVREEGLAGVADELGLGGAIRLGRGEAQTGGREKRSILANAFEAIIGAIFLDGGFDSALAVVARLFGPRVAGAADGMRARDPKTSLQELVQAAYRTTPRYTLVESRGPEHQKTFEVALIVRERELARGAGRSKKEAEQAAAARLLEQLNSGETLEDLITWGEAGR